MWSSVVLDEVHCLWPSCCHTCCWEAEQRIREGHPRLLKEDTTKPFTRPCKESRFPVCSLVDAADWIEDDFISWMALPIQATSQKHCQSTSPMSAKMERNQDKNIMKTGVADTDWESLAIQVFPPEEWMSPHSDVETGRLSEVHSPTPSMSSSCKVRAATASPKIKIMDPKVRHRALKNTDKRLSRHIFQSARQLEINADLQSDTELCIRGITAPRNSKQSSVASSTVELNQLHLEN